MAEIYYKYTGSEILMAGASVLLKEVAAGGNTYSDNFDSLAYSDYLIGQSYWISGLNDLAVWQAAAGNNVVSPYTSSAYVSAIYNQALTNDQYAQIKNKNTTSDGRIGVGVRLSGSASTFCGYGFTISAVAGYCAIVKFINGVATVLGTAGTTNAAANDIFKITAVGTTISVYKNGSLFTSVGTGGQVTDSTYTTGKAGIVGYGAYNDAIADEFECGDI